MKNNSSKFEYFQTPDLALCAALCCLDYRVEKIEKDSQRAFFFIAKDEKIDKLIERFWAHQLKVDALGYFNFLKELKTRIYTL